ncbi:hypothetical protein PHYSODRAFT_506965 [Phytophthora sojae]|uniref:Core-binding (CB) domain-containing protein n=1 Tax=Phytophthora sojae (strain P6497) TaxID=1094619 RepID=G4ZMW3_PHYSP|nr:hypothetical protein PHYSODRAFT_506965 [Phytophthora sojae]EGZ14686.1 hypothetical protein PHYSODRAFT_506965 [Phytophthora sojae]|eukprot:XP_009528435.1 hypothetical protein PHYSODRAFT_506965 [Phytophthora sojae]
MYLREHSVADPTHDKYKRAFGRWEQWCKQFGFPIWLTRVNTDQQAVIVSDFIVSCTRSGRNGRQPKSDTIANTLHGINHFFKARALAFPVGHPQVCMLLKGLRRLDTPEQRKAPVTLSLLRAVFNRLDLNSPAYQALWGHCV